MDNVLTIIYRGGFKECNEGILSSNIVNYFLINIYLKAFYILITNIYTSIKAFVKDNSIGMSLLIPTDMENSFNRKYIIRWES